MDFIIPNNSKKTSSETKITNNVFMLDDISINDLKPKYSKKKGKPTICFATMCKNEEHCIRETLENVAPYIDYWVVADNGSTDKTCEIVEEFFKEKNIPGELIHDEWYGFDVNKTMLFNYCYKKADYILHLDADDLIVGDFSFTEDDAGCLQYFCWAKRGENSTFRYKILLMFNNDYHWKFCGVAHTTIKCLDCNDDIPNYGYLTNQNFFMNSRDTGNRSSDPEKYYKDALKLTDQFFRTLVEDPDNLNSRSIFYTAQSYYDSSRLENAAQWYSLYTKINHGWIEETFESYLRLAEIFKRLQKGNNYVINAYKKAMEILPDRAEPIVYLGIFYNNIRKFNEAYELLNKAKKMDFEVARKKYSLYVNERTYGKYINDELSVTCFWLGMYEESKKYIFEIIDDPDFEMHRERIQKNLEYANERLSKT
jgi:glycosyltransferase involved in cell wall biosynthesis